MPGASAARAGAAAAAAPSSSQPAPTRTATRTVGASQTRTAGGYPSSSRPPRPASAASSSRTTATSTTARGGGGGGGPSGSGSGSGSGAAGATASSSSSSSRSAAPAIPRGSQNTATTRSGPASVSNTRLGTAIGAKDIGTAASSTTTTADQLLSSSPTDAFPLTSIAMSNKASQGLGADAAAPSAAAAAAAPGPSRLPLTIDETNQRLLALFDLPTPDWTRVGSSLSEPPAEDDVLSRLLDLASSYLFGTTMPASAKDGSSKRIAPDLLSASLYAFMAHSLRPTSVRAVHLMALVLLHGHTTPFPFSPSPMHVDVPSPSAAWSPLLPELPTGSAPFSRAGAHHALHVLQDGPAQIFQDSDCAAVYASACKALGRYREAFEALWWTRARGKDKAEQEEVVAVALAESSVTPTPSAVSDPPKSRGALARGEATREDVKAAEALDDAAHRMALGWLARQARMDSEATEEMAEALKADPWRWSSWIGMCDAAFDQQRGFEGDPPASFLSAPKHHPKDFFSALFRERLEAAGIQVVTRPDGSLAVESGSLPGVSPGSGVNGAPGAVVERPGSVAMANVPSSDDGSMMSRFKGLTTSVGPNSTLAPSEVAEEEEEGEEEENSMVKPRAAINRSRQISSSQPNPSTHVRPGSRPTPSGVAGVVTGSKRARTGLPVAGSTASRTASQNGTLSSSQPAPRPGMLGASRTNEQLRPSSSASGTSRGTAMDRDDEKLTTVRRVTRAASASVDKTALGNRMAAARQTVATAASRTARPGALPSSAMAGRAGTTATSGASTTTAASRLKAAAGLRRPGPQPRGHSTTASSSETDVAGAAQSARRAAEAQQKLREAASGAAVAAASEAARLAARWTAADELVMRLVRRLALAYRAARCFEGRKALWLLRAKGSQMERPRRHFRDLDDLQGFDDVDAGLATPLRNSAEVRCLLGRVSHDMGDYAAAEIHFEYARRLVPCLTVNMDIFSLTLFHLNREAVLSQLAASLSDLDPGSCAAAIAVGNGFSLHRDHLSALREFRRAALVAPNHAYAYTLAGYEALELDQHDKAIAFWRRALRCDKRHWNAWVGMASAFWRAEKYSDARIAYDNALAINRSNAIILSLAGRAREALGSHEAALQTYTMAIRAAPNSVMTRLHRAHLLVKMDRLDSAHEELLTAVSLAPDEASLHLELAKSFMRLGGGKFSETEKSRRAAAAPHHQNSARIRAKGEAKLPESHQAQIAYHLAAAIHLDPSLGREIKAMGEGIKATLRGVASRIGGPRTGVDSYLIGDRTIAETTFEGTLEDQVYEDMVGGSSSIEETSVEQHGYALEPNLPSPLPNGHSQQHRHAHHQSGVTEEDGTYDSGRFESSGALAGDDEAMLDGEEEEHGDEDVEGEEEEEEGEDVEDDSENVRAETMLNVRGRHDGEASYEGQQHLQHHDYSAGTVHSLQGQEAGEDSEMSLV